MRRNLQDVYDQQSDGPSTSAGPGQLRAPHAAVNLNAAREVTDKLFLEAEKYKAGLAAPKGMVPIDDNVKLLRQFDSDDDFFHVTCHVDQSLCNKIEMGEFVELERLLPKDNSTGLGCLLGSDFMQLVNCDGRTYFAPANPNSQKINNVRKWNQAFRIYAAIYSEVNPSRSAEIWQYIYVIHRAAAVYNWENVAFYDFTFRQLMASKPWRSYTQAWNLAMNEPMSKHSVTATKQSQGDNHNQSANLTNQRVKNWRDYCCWKFNKNKCKRSNCSYDHRYTYCGAWNHGFYNCRKRLRNSGSGGDSGSGD